MLNSIHYLTFKKLRLMLGLLMLAYVFMNFHLRRMCICAHVSVCANAPPRSSTEAAAERPGAPAGTDRGWSAAAHGWCRLSRWSPPSAPPGRPADCPCFGVTRSTGSPAGTPRLTGQGLQEWRRKDMWELAMGDKSETKNMGYFC